MPRRRERLGRETNESAGATGHDDETGKATMSNVSEWVEVCDADEIDEEDVIRFDHGGRTFAVYRLEGDEYRATDGLCTHEQVHLSGGLVMDAVIECPKHNGRFDVRTGKAKGAPVCVDLTTYPVKIEGGKVLLGVPRS